MEDFKHLKFKYSYDFVQNVKIIKDRINPHEVNDILEYILFDELNLFLKNDNINKLIFVSFILRIFDLIIRDNQNINISQDNIDKIIQKKYYDNKQTNLIQQTKNKDRNQAAIEAYGRVLKEDIPEDIPIIIEKESDMFSYEDSPEYKKEYSSHFGEADVEQADINTFREEYSAKMKELGSSTENGDNAENYENGDDDVDDDKLEENGDDYGEEVADF